VRLALRTCVRLLRAPPAPPRSCPAPQQTGQRAASAHAEAPATAAPEQCNEAKGGVGSSVRKRPGHRQCSVAWLRVRALSLRADLNRSVSSKSSPFIGVASLSTQGWQLLTGDGCYAARGLRMTGISSDED